MAKKHLVIVESPAKAKTIGKYLGKDYEVKASMGHLRDLPKSKLGVDIEHDFEPVYQPIRGKEELISELKKAAKSSDTVYLATDPDREGEAISWHLKALLNLDDEKAKRVTFNEITKKVVSESIKEPRAIDQDLVDAQQARRVLDRIVGYQLSPLLWKKVRRGLSAGRVQSVAVRMVDDREKEIQAFEAQEYWTLDADLTDEATHKTFEAHYYGKDGKKVEPTSGEQVDGIIADIGDKPFTVTNIKRTDKQRSPSLPFTTSTLQQEASRKLNMTPRRTMAIAQQLYEGVDITGEGTVGLDHLHAYRLAAHLRRGHRRSEDVYFRTLRAELLSQDRPPLQGQGRRAGRARGHPPLERQPDARADQGRPDGRAVPPVPPDLEPLFGLPDGERCV